MSNQTRLTYCTIGILLRRLQSDPNLQDITHVVVDEVHERSVDIDFLLVILKQLLKKKNNNNSNNRNKDYPFKVILMSASANAQMFGQYFQQERDNNSNNNNNNKTRNSTNNGNTRVQLLTIPGRVFPVKEYYLEDVLSMVRYHPNQMGSGKKRGNTNNNNNNEDQQENKKSYIKGN